MYLMKNEKAFQLVIIQLVYIIIQFYSLHQLLMGMYVAIAGLANPFMWLPPEKYMFKVSTIHPTLAPSGKTQ